ncbi:MAG: ribonuclease E activity regulator RraA [Gammaproteobacteria bacterium]
MACNTTDLCDQLGDAARVAAPLFRDFGGAIGFAGPISTVKCHEDNSLVRAALQEPGAGRVLVVDGGGSLRCALLGDMLAQFGVDNGWAGILVYGCIRDAGAIARMPIGVKALAAHPRKSVKRGIGERDVAVRFADVTFLPGDMLYADVDGVLVTAAAPPA